jgi:hypothetical protein
MLCVARTSLSKAPTDPTIERGLVGRVNVLCRVGNGPGLRRPRRYYGGHAARRHDDTKLGRLWTFEIKFAVTGAVTSCKVVAFLQVPNHRWPDGLYAFAFVGVVLAGGLRLQRPSHTPSLSKPCRRDAILSIRR